MQVGDDTEVGLDRHVLPVRGQGGSGGGHGAEVVLDEDGFLEVPTGPRAWFYGGPVPVAVTDLIDSEDSFVLLAPGGVGKSTVLDALRHREHSATAVNLRTLGKGGTHQALGAAVERGGPVYLDGLDAVAGRVPEVFEIIEHHMTQPGAGRVRWRLACRPAVWDATFATAVHQALPGFRELRLLPLTRTAATALAVRAGAQEGFLEAVTRARLGRLAASAMRLEAAATQWRDTSVLPDSHLSGIAYEVEQLLTELNPRVSTTVPVDRRLRIAMRLAAMSVFGRVHSFARHPLPEVPGRRHLGGLPSTPEPDEPGTPITHAELEEVIDTALFHTAPDNAVAFQHEQYAEYLAARYITTRQITQHQLHRLLGVGPDGRIPGFLAGVTAWLAALAPALVDDLVAANALTLARTGVEIPSDAVRARVVAAILDQAAEGDIDHDWGLDLDVLGHPGLQDQLREHLEAGLSHDVQVWWIGRLAEDGRCDGLAEALLSVALDARWAPRTRRTVVSAIASFQIDQVTRGLAPLLRLEPADDPDDDLLAGALDALYPRLMGTDELLEALRPRRNTDLVGAYLLLLGRLADRIDPHDLPTVLDWATRRIPAGEEAYGQLIPRLIQAAWPHAGTTPVSEPLARLIAAVISNQWTPWNRHDQPQWSHREDPPWSDGPTQPRRLVVTLLADHLDPLYAYELHGLGLIGDSDLGWLITTLPGLPPTAQKALAESVPDLLTAPDAHAAGLILSLPADHPAQRVTEYLRGSVPVDSPQAQRFLRKRQRQADIEPHRAQRDERHRRRLIEAIDTATGDLDSWWRIVELLAEPDDSHHAAAFRADLTARPGWALLDESQQQQVLDLGVRYVQGRSALLPAGHGIGTIVPSEVAPDWAAVYLLATVARHRPAVLQSLAPDVWRSWAPAIIAAWNSGEEKDRALRIHLIDLAPQDTRANLAEAALERLDAHQAHGSAFSFGGIYRRLAPELAPEIANRLIAGRYDGALAAALLDLLINEFPHLARSLCNRLRTHDDPAIARLARRGQAALDPDSVIDDLISTDIDSDELADLLRPLDIAALDGTRLHRLTKVLLDRYPYGADPDFMSEDYSSNSVYSIRDRLLTHLAARGHHDTLALLRDDRPDLDRTVLGAHLRRARDQATNLAYTPLDPADLLTLLSQADTRLIRTADHLLDVVLENLRELQHQITNRGAFNDLWNLGEPPFPKAEDIISDWIQRTLNPLLGTTAVVEREPQARRVRPSGTGTRMDLTVTAPIATQPGSTARVIIEAKLVNHSRLLTSLHEQLVDRYLRRTGTRHGIYLVYWVEPAWRPSDWTNAHRHDAQALQQQLTEQAAQVDAEYVVHPFLLDITPPYPSSAPRTGE